MPDTYPSFFLSFFLSLSLSVSNSDSSASPVWPSNPISFSTNFSVTLRLPTIPDDETDVASHYVISYRIAHNPTTYSPWQRTDRAPIGSSVYTLYGLHGTHWYQILVHSESDSGKLYSLPSAVVEHVPIGGVPGK